jgi:YidC/Oxa1 family membrane protein insertase
MNILQIFQIILIQPLANGLILFYKLLGQNMGIAIIGFSFFLRLILNPLTKPYMESMKKIKQFEPQLSKLKLKYKDDKKKLMEAQAELYKQNKINPSAGCLPYIIQIVILIALFNVFTQVLTPKDGDISKFNALLYSPLKLSETQTLNTSFLYLDVRKPDTFRIPNIPFPIPGPILILAALAQFVSAKMTMPFIKAEEKIAKKTKTETDDMQVAMQSSMVYTFPFFTLIFGINFPSGLALYWLLFSAWQVWQQYKTSGWGSLTPFISRLGLVKSKDIQNQ